MSLTVYTDEKRPRQQRQVGGDIIHVRHYTVPAGGTISGSNLELGMTLPDNDLAVIIDSDIIEGKSGEGLLARVIAKTAIPYTGDDTGGIVELSRSRGVTRRGENVWDGESIYRVPNGQANAFASSRWDMRYPELAGDYAPRVRGYKVDKNAWARGQAIVSLWYKTVRVPGKARILTRHLELSARPRILDLDGKTIEGADRHTGPDGRGDPGKYWHVRQGEELASETLSVTLVALETAFYVADFKLASFGALKDSVNDGTLTRMGGAAKGSMLYRGIDTRYELGEDLINANVFFWWGTKDWNSLILSEYGSWCVEEIPVFRVIGTDKDPEPLDQIRVREALVFSPGSYNWNADHTTPTWTKEDPEPRRMFEYKNFGFLDAMVSA